MILENGSLLLIRKPDSRKSTAETADSGNVAWSKRPDGTKRRMRSDGEKNGKNAATCFSRIKTRSTIAVTSGRASLRSQQNMKAMRLDRWKWRAGSLTGARKTERYGI